MLDSIDMVELLIRKFRRKAFDALSQHGGRDGLLQFARELLAGGQRLPRHAAPGRRALDRALFHDHQNAHMTRASNFSFSTSFAAASLGGPSNNWVCLDRPGRYTRLSWMEEAVEAAPNPAAVTLRISLFLAFLIPMRVA